MSSLLLWTTPRVVEWRSPPPLVAWLIVYVVPNFICPSLSSSFLLSVFLSFCLSMSLSSSHLSFFSPPPPYFHQCCCLFSLVFSSLIFLSLCALCPAASESVLLQQLFQSKLTQTGSLVPASQGRMGLRGPKAALLLHRMPSASLSTANSVPQQPRRYHDLTKVLYTAHSVMSLVLHWFVALSLWLHWIQENKDIFYHINIFFFIIFESQTCSLPFKTKNCFREHSLSESDTITKFIFVSTGNWLLCPWVEKAGIVFWGEKNCLI